MDLSNLIPDDAKPHEVGVYIAYTLLNVRTPAELQRMFHYADRSSINRILRKIRARKTTTSEVHEYEAHNPPSIA